MTPKSPSNARLYQRAKQLIPGGTQLFSKRPELFAPDAWPAYFREASGCEIEDFDGRKLLDMSTSGIGTCLLGYADPDVNQAVIERVKKGSMCSLNAPEEVQLAELLLDLHPWARQVRYARTGGEAMAIAIRIARAKTGRDRILFCGYHGWSDWYAAANLSGDALAGHLLEGLPSRGVPLGLRETALPFPYNELNKLRSMVKQHGRQLAAIVMEPTRASAPTPGFLEGVRQLCDDCGAQWIMDEISMGWRLHLGGAHLHYGAEPDVAVFAKALSNGHPMAAIIGKTDVMQAAQDSFISSTYWTESVGPVAALATIAKMQTIDIPAHVRDIGAKAMQVWQDLGASHQVPVAVAGHPAMAHLEFVDEDRIGLETFFTVRMLDRGILATSRFYPSLAHTDRQLDQFTSAADRVFAEIAHARNACGIRDALHTPVRHSTFQRIR